MPCDAEESAGAAGRCEAGQEGFLAVAEEAGEGGGGLGGRRLRRRREAGAEEEEGGDDGGAEQWQEHWEKRCGCERRKRSAKEAVAGMVGAKLSFDVIFAMLSF